MNFKNYSGFKIKRKQTILAFFFFFNILTSSLGKKSKSVCGSRAKRDVKNQNAHFEEALNFVVFKCSLLWRKVLGAALRQILSLLSIMKVF